MSSHFFFFLLAVHPNAAIMQLGRDCSCGFLSILNRQKVVGKGYTIEFLRNIGLTLKNLFKQKFSLIVMSISQHACGKINIGKQNLIFERKPTDYLIQLPTQCRALQFCQRVINFQQHKMCGVEFTILELLWKSSKFLKFCLSD